MNIDRLLTITSVFAAACAAGGGAWQAYETRLARYDQFRSAAFAQGITRCGEAISQSNSYIYASMDATSGKSAEKLRKFIDASDQLEVSLESLALLAGPIAPDFSESLGQMRTQMQSASERIYKWHNDGADVGKIGVSINKTTEGLREACKLFVQSSILK